MYGNSCFATATRLLFLLGRLTSRDQILRGSSGEAPAHLRSILLLLAWSDPRWNYPTDGLYSEIEAGSSSKSNTHVREQSIQSLLEFSEPKHPGTAANLEYLVRRFLPYDRPRPFLEQLPISHLYQVTLGLSVSCIRSRTKGLLAKPLSSQGADPWHEQVQFRFCVRRGHLSGVIIRPA